MNGLFRTVVRQPRVGRAFMALGLVAIAAPSSLELHGASGISFVALALAAGLAAAVVVAYNFPIYIRHNTKICVVSIPLFLMAATLPPGLAGGCALVAVAAAELTVQSRRGTHGYDIAAAAGRWGFLTVAASALAHVGLPLKGDVGQDIPIVAAAAFLWFGDLLTLPFLLYPVCKESPARIVNTVVREGGLAEASQYAIGLIGVLLVSQQVWALGLLVVPAGLVYLAFTKEMDVDTFQLLESMADSVDLRDPYTAGHSRRVAALVEGIMDQLGMHGQEARQIITSARLHDIGKIGLPDEILIKPMSLTPEEQAVMQSYPDRAAEILGGYPDFARGIEMVRHHHERWDGTGYPGKLTGTDIPFGARVIAVADSYDAMTSDRPYRRALTPEQTAQILCDGSGRQWDPQIVDAFLRSVSGRLSSVPESRPERGPVEAVILAGARKATA